MWACWTRSTTSRDRIKLVSPRHEQVAAHMADAYFRVRHEPVATLTSCGPGSCNIVMPLRWRRSRFLGAAGDHRQRADPAVQPQSPFQEINKHFQADFPNIIRPVVKRSFQPTRVDMLPLALRQADDDHAVGPARAGESRRAVQRVPGRATTCEMPPARRRLNTPAQRRLARGDVPRCVDLILKAPSAR